MPVKLKWLYAFMVPIRSKISGGCKPTGQSHPRKFLLENIIT